MAIWAVTPKELDADASRQVLTKRMTELRKESTRQYADVHVAGEKVSRYASARTCLLISGEEVTLPDRHEKGMIALALKEESYYGTAVPISADGYLLTAAHCLHAAEVTLIVKDEETLVRKVTPRVVWRGRFEGGEEPDLAVLHVPMSFGREKCFDIEDAAADADRDALVFNNGYGVGLEAVCAGKVLEWIKESAKARGVPWRTLRHSAPLTRGDSGGAVFDEAGRLLGINVRIQGTVRRWLGRDLVRNCRTEAVAPDYDWLRRVLQQDRAKRATAGERDGAAK
ncbi:MAG TPA: serine protease [Prosthecobacter sp.]|nr:serine protease [Prosthecobacter sp.]